MKRVKYLFIAGIIERTLKDNKKLIK